MELNEYFSMQDLGEAKYCLGLSIIRDRKAPIEVNIKFAKKQEAETTTYIQLKRKGSEMVSDILTKTNLLQTIITVFLK